MGDAGGRPEFVPTPVQRAVVVGMAAAGVRQEWICLQVVNPATGQPIDRKTLRKAFRAELADAKPTATTLVTNKLFEQCMAGDMGAIKFWLTNRSPDEWKSRTESLHGGVAGSPIVLQAGSPDADI